MIISHGQAVFESSLPPGITAGEPALSFTAVHSCTPRAEQVQELSQTGLG